MDYLNRTLSSSGYLLKMSAFEQYLFLGFYSDLFTSFGTLSSLGCCTLKITETIHRYNCITSNVGSPTNEEKDTGRTSTLILETS